MLIAQHLGNRISICVALGLVIIAGCGAPSDETAKEGGPAPLFGISSEARSAEPLTLDRTDPERISGAFWEGSIGLRFEATRTASSERISLLTRDHRPLLQREGRVDDGAGGVPSVAIMGEDLAFEQGEPGPREQALLRELLDLPEIKLLPRLSYELGARGLRGDTHPAALPIHTLVLSVASAAPQGADTGVPAAAKGDAPTVTGSCEPAEQYECQTYPTGSSCDGMCGPNSECWSWVCGDCCWHQGCQAHDTACALCNASSQCCVGCYGAFAAFYWPASPCSGSSSGYSFPSQNCF